MKAPKQQLNGLYAWVHCQWTKGILVVALYFLLCAVFYTQCFFSWLQSTLVGNEFYEMVAVHKPIFTRIQIQVENESFYHGKK